MATGTYIFASVIASVAAVGPLIAGLAGLSPPTRTPGTQLFKLGKIRFTSELINGLFTFLQKLLRSYNGTVIFSAITC